MATTMFARETGYINNQNVAAMLSAQATNGTSVLAQVNNPLVNEIQDFLELQAVSALHLYRLKRLLDTECLRYTTGVQPMLEDDLTNQFLANLVKRLCSPLEDYLDADSPAFTEIQLRALIATLALLHVKGASAIRFEVYDDIRNEKLGRFYSTICQQHKEEGHPTTNTNVYLIQLALQYFARFRCFTNQAFETTAPVLDIAFASVPLVSHSSKCRV